MITKRQLEDLQGNKYEVSVNSGMSWGWSHTSRNGHVNKRTVHDVWVLWTKCLSSRYWLASGILGVMWSSLIGFTSMPTCYSIQYCLWFWTVKGTLK